MLSERQINGVKKFCKDNIKEIEGYNEAITSDKRYCCHHKLGINVSYKELIEKGLYYDRPACELIFLSISEHTRLHKQNLREETKQKLSGENNGMYGKGYLLTGGKNGNAKRCTINGITYGSLGEAHKALYPNIPYGTFQYRYNKGDLS